MSTTHSATGRRPDRRVQLVIWLLFAAALIAGFASSGYLDAAAPPVQPAPAAATVAADGELTLAGPDSGGGGSGSAPGSDVASLKKTYGENPDKLLPAYRWDGVIILPHDFGITDMVVPGGESTQTAFAGLLFTIASWTWKLLLMIVKFAIGMDLVSTAASQIDGAFRTAAEGLGKSGLPVLAVLIAAFLAGMRILRGKMNQTISLILGSALVIGGLSFLTAATAGPVQTFRANGETIQATSKGSPAYIAQRGNAFINTVVGQVTSGFGATNAITREVRNGTFATNGDTGGATCNYYVRQLYATHRNLSEANGASADGPEANALAMVSFMWQRGLYDNYTMAAFGSLGDGSRITCHMLERFAGTQAVEQFAVVGGDGKHGTAKYGPYKGMKLGPFVPTPSIEEDDVRAARLAWAACGGPDGKTARAGWDTAGRVTDEACADWWNWVPEDKFFAEKYWDAYGPGDSDVGINSGAAENILKWKNMSELRSSTTWDGDGGTVDQAALEEVHTVVSAYYGHNGGQRMLAGLMALVSAGLYAWAFGAAALGTIATQIGLLFFLTLLPYTLLLLAFPTKDGGRSKLGVRMLKMTGAFFAGKAVFLALLATTVQLMSMLFTVAGTFTGSEGVSAAPEGGLVLAAAGDGAGTYMVWSLVIPAATVFILRSLTKSLGLGDLMSLSGAAGFATSAVLSGRENRRARSGFQGSLNGSLAGRALNRADSMAKSPGRLAKRGLGTAAGSAKDATKNHLKHRSANRKLARALENGDITAEQMSRIASGKLSLDGAIAESKIARKHPDLPPDMVRAVAAGRLTAKQARMIAADQTQTRERDTAEDPATLGGFDGARERVGALGAQEVGAGTVFGDTFNTDAERESLRALQTERQALLDIKNKGVGEEEWEANSIESMLANLEALRAASQGLDIGRSLTAAEVQSEKARVAEAAGIPQDMLMLGDSGVPPLIAGAARSLDGTFQFPEDLSREATLSLIMNPLNYLDIEKRLDETADQFHLRAALELQAAGLMDDAGNFADIFKAEGIDVGTVSGQQELLLAAAGDSKVLRLEDLSFSVSDADRRAIDAVVADHYPIAAPAMHAAQGEQVDSVNSLAASTHDKVATIVDEVHHVVDQVASAQGGSDFGAQMDQALRMFEERVPAVMGDLGALALEAQVTNDWITGAISDQSKLAERFEQLAERGENQMRDFGRDLVNQVATLKLDSDPVSQAEELRKLAGEIERVLGTASSDMRDSVETMVSHATDQQRGLQQQLAGQARPPLRAVDFSGGARDMS